MISDKKILCIVGQKISQVFWTILKWESHQRRIHHCHKDIKDKDPNLLIVGLAMSTIPKQVHGTEIWSKKRESHQKQTGLQLPNIWKMTHLLTIGRIIPTILKKVYQTETITTQYKNSLSGDTHHPRGLIWNLMQGLQLHLIKKFIRLLMNVILQSMFSTSYMPSHVQRYASQYINPMQQHYILPWSGSNLNPLAGSNKNLESIDVSHMSNQMPT